jgi:carbon-monoxide dehydrogenase medium subunit
VAPTPIRAKEAERVLEGNRLNDHLIREAGEKARRECSPITDIRSSAEYRREMVGVLVEKAIQQCIKAS